MGDALAYFKTNSIVLDKDGAVEYDPVVSTGIRLRQWGNFGTGGCNGHRGRPNMQGRS
jgi:hypothetical protein